MNFSPLFSCLSTPTAQTVPVSQSLARFLCQQPPGDPQASLPLEATADYFEVRGKSISLGSEDTESQEQMFRLQVAPPKGEVHNRQREGRLSGSVG